MAYFINRLFSICSRKISIKKHNLQYYRNLADITGNRDGCVVIALVVGITVASILFPGAKASPVSQLAEVKKETREHSAGGLDHGDIHLMARVIEGEAADESFRGKVAVGAVIMNRTRSGDFPGEVDQVVQQPLAFEAVANGQYLRPLTDESVRAALMAADGQDPTGGALYYWNPSTATSKWVWQRPIIHKIGNHVFAR